MPRNEAEVMQRKIMRGAFLQVLNELSNPTLMQTVVLAVTAMHAGTEDEAVPCANFLLDRGYIRVVSPEDGQKTAPALGVLLRITDKGQDVCDGTTKDAGIILPISDGR